MSKRKKSVTLKRLMRYMSYDKAALARIIILLVASTIFAIFAPMTIAKITDSIKQSIELGKDIDFLTIGNMLIILAALYIISNFCLYSANKQMIRISQTTVCNMRQDIQKKLQRVSLDYTDSNQRGDILARTTSDIVTITNTLEDNLAPMITKITTIVGTIIMMLFANVQLSLIFILLIPASMLAIRLIMKATQKLFKQQQQALGDLNGHIEEMTAGHEVMRAFNYEEEAANRMEVINQRFFKTYLKSRTLSGFILPIIRILNNIVYIAVCVFGGAFILNGTLTLGGLQAFLMYANNISTPIGQFSVQLNQIQGGLAAAQRVFGLLDAEEEIPEAPSQIINPNDVKGKVSFEHVQFGYSPEKILMHDVSFEVNPGEVFAIVGPSGAGKTTLVNLLMRFYELNGGEIKLEGKDIKKLGRKNLRECMGMVLQDTWIFNGTIAENISYGKPSATRQEVISAAVQAQCDGFIHQLPQGYDTHINEATATLSAGEKQLLAIARTVIADPKILILDEATSNIDTRTEVMITKAMKKMMENRTTFMIAHRLFTIKNADAIIFMKDGDILEVGNHNELMKKGGYYAEMYLSSSD